MAVLQSVYNESPVDGRPGMVANGETSNRISRVVEDAAGIAFGRFAFRGVSDRGCTGTPAAGAVLGVVIADKSLTPVPGGPLADIVAQRATAGILAKGSIWVTAGEAITAGAQVYVTAAGAIVDTSTDNIIAPGWFFDQAAANATPVRITRR